MTRIDPYSAAALQILLKCNGNPMGCATGFLYERHGRKYLVSNWHVFAGREPDTGQPKNRDGAIPDEISWTFFVDGTNGKFVNSNMMLRREDGSPSWVQHPRGRAVDIAAYEFFCSEVSLPNGSVGVLPAINQLESMPNMLFGIASDIYILGFPFSQQKAGQFAVWKRASVATEPDISIDGVQKFLADTATRPGMSGAPVIARSSGGTLTDRNSFVAHGIHTRFIGVYSGRLHGAEDQIQLGYVWRESLLHELIDNPVPGDNSFDGH